MSEAIITAEKKSPEALGAEIRSLTTQARCMTVYFGVEIGRRLAEAKSMVPYGTWGDWLKKETEFSQSTATRFMRVFEEYGADQIGIFGAVADSSTLQNLSISNALRLLAVPSEEREEFAKEVDAEHISARELEKVIAERDEARAQAKAAEAKRKMEKEDDEKFLNKAQENIRKLDAENQMLNQKVVELESRPVEVAVQRDEAAIREAADAATAAAEEKWKKELESAKAAGEKEASLRQKLEKQLKKAKAELQKPDNSAEQIAAMQAEIDQLTKQLRTSEPEVQAVKFCLSALQKAYRELETALEMCEPTKAEKLKGAVKAQLEAWIEGE